MSGTDTLPIQISPDGVKGLAMMAPVIGFPLIVHALTGAVITGVAGVGLAAISSVMGPFKEDILQATKGMLVRQIPCDSHDVPVNSVIDIVSVTENPSCHESV
ncbi:MAG: hypothetical protein HGB00_09105 [Chlorobiaceae bacterium]|nr:hypothetical protein [Chlorobiaceae bacterium]